MSYEEKQQAKLERYKELAYKNASASVSVREYGDRIADAIPLGQPILIGHHSEAGHRRDLEKIRNSMDKSIELSKKSEYYENKVNNILNPTSISSDNPEAITLLKEKLANLEKERILIKSRPHEHYELPNLSGQIRQVKQRIKHLESLKKVQDSEEVINGITIKIDKEDNRIKLIFPGKPDQKVIDELKHSGFHWSPYNKSWQRQISDWAIYLAKKIAGGKK